MNYFHLFVRIIAVLLAALTVVDMVSIPACLDGLVYYVFNAPSKSWQEVGVWCCLLLISRSILIFTPAPANRAVVVVAGICAVGVIMVLTRKLYQTLDFIIMGRRILIENSTESLFSASEGRVFGILIILAPAIWVSLKSIKLISAPRNTSQ